MINLNNKGWGLPVMMMFLSVLIGALILVAFMSKEINLYSSVANNIIINSYNIQY